MWHIPTHTYDPSITIEYSVKTEDVSDVTDSPSTRIADSPSSRIADSPLARIADSPSSRIADSPFARIADSPSSWSSIQSPPITSTPFIRRPARLTPYSRRNQREEIRQQEEIRQREEIQYLNDRLSSYSKLVQYLEMENSHLKQEVRTSQETITREVSNSKAMFDLSLSNKMELEQTEMKCLKLDTDNKRLQDINEDLQNELKKKARDLKIAEKKIDRLTALLDARKYMEVDTLQLQEICNTQNNIERQTTQVKSSEGVAIEELRHSRTERLNSRISEPNIINNTREDSAFSQGNERVRFTERLTGLEVELARMRDILTNEFKSEETRLSVIRYNQ